MRYKNMINQYCDEQPTCEYCPIKKLIPICGRGWHVAMDGNVKQQEAAILIFNGAKILKEVEPHYEE